MEHIVVLSVGEYDFCTVSERTSFFIRLLFFINPVLALCFFLEIATSVRIFSSEDVDVAAFLFVNMRRR